MMIIIAATPAPAMSIPPSIRSGTIGKMRVHASGRVTMEIGGVLFDVGDADERDAEERPAPAAPAASSSTSSSSSTAESSASAAEAAAHSSAAYDERRSCSFHQQVIGINLNPGVLGGGGADGEGEGDGGGDGDGGDALAAAAVAGMGNGSEPNAIGGSLRIYGDVDNTFVVTPDINAALAALAVQRVGSPL